MPFPSNEGNTTLEDAWSAAMGYSSRIKRTAQSLFDATLTPCTAESILSATRKIIASKNALAALASIPGLQAYARDQIEDQTLDLVASYTALVAAVDGVRDWVFTNLPKATPGTPYLLVETIDTELAVTDREFSSISLGGLRTALIALIATID